MKTRSLWNVVLLYFLWYHRIWTKKWKLYVIQTKISILILWESTNKATVCWFIYFHTLITCRSSIFWKFIYSFSAGRKRLRVRNFILKKYCSLQLENDIYGNEQSCGKKLFVCIKIFLRICSFLRKVSWKRHLKNLHLKIGFYINYFKRTPNQF